MGRIRTFIGVAVGDGTRKAAAALQQRLAAAGAAVKWVEPQNLHVSLLFLGDVDDRDLPAVCRAVADAAGGEPPFPLRVAGVGAFPTPRRPKTVWAGVTDGAANLHRLHGLLEGKLLALGCYRREERAYTPHLTLGRVKRDDGGPALGPELARLMAWDGGRAVVDEVLVFSSELRRDGPEYAVLARGGLTGKGPPA